ncbi:MAG: cob(I)yrinic acid a,c-diamide adenosyltransferase [Candidatus Eisenbacteria bacterium]
MKIYTRTGDGGDTGILGSQRVPKSHVRIDAYGEVDELNSLLGWMRAGMEDPAVSSLVESIQGLLFEVGAELARPPSPSGVAHGTLREEDVTALERAIDRMESNLPPLSAFVLPGGSEAGCRAHLARTVCRRAERAVVRLLLEEPYETLAVRFLNRLSDFLFVLARKLNQDAGATEKPWVARRRGGAPASGSESSRPKSD